MSIERSICRATTRAKVSPAAAGELTKVLEPQYLLNYITRRCQAIFNNTNYGLEFVKVERCTAQETINFLLSKSDKEYDISKSSMYLARFTFKAGKSMLTAYTNLPYIVDEIFIYISGTPYTVVPVLSDKCISPGIRSVFVRYLKNKMNIANIKYNILRDKIIKDVVIPHTEPLTGKRLTQAPKVPILWYLISRYGVTETLRQIHDCEVLILDDKRVQSYRDNPKYTVYSTVYGDHPTIRSVSTNQKGQRVRTLRDTRLSQYTQRYKFVNGGFKDRAPTRIHFAVKNKDATTLMDQTMASLFYILDIMPDIKPKDILNRSVIEHILTVTLFKEPGKNDISSMRKKLIDKLATLDGHVDKYMQETLKSEFGDTLKEDFSSDGFYKIMKVIFIRHKVWSESSRHIIANVTDKRFEILDYLTVPLFTKLNKMNFTLTQATANKGVKPDVFALSKALTKYLTLSIMYAIRMNTPSCTRITYAGDNKYFKYTSTLHLQVNATSATGNKSSKKKGSQKSFMDPCTLIHESHPFAGTSVGVAKSRDTGLKYHGLFSPLHPITNTIVPTEAQLKRSKPLENILRNMANRSRDINVPEEFARQYQPVNYDDDLEI